jgi:predicted dehydrogenase/nucleoside-diphosphate-sugar epimerase
MGEPVRVGLVGAGYVASRHLRALKDLPFVEVVGICDLDEARASAMASHFGVARFFRSLVEMAAARPQVVHVLTPPVSHCALTLEALEMGCHVFVEKPLAETVEECDRMIAKAREKGLALSVNHSLLFEPSVRDALGHVAERHCGDLLAMHYFRGSDYPPYAGGTPSAVYRQGSYPFRDVGVHAIYLLEAFLGTLHKLEARYYSSGRDPMITFDEWRISAEGENKTGQALLSWNMRPPQNEIWIHGTRGVLHVNLVLDQCHLYRNYPGPRQISLFINGLRHAAASLFQIPWFFIRAATGLLKPSQGIYNSVIAFHKALAEGRPSPLSPDEGRRVVAWMVAGAQAADDEKNRRERVRQQAPPPARILVTGAAGFLGSALVRSLVQGGERPRVFLRRPVAAGSAAADVDAVYGNLGEAESVDRAVAGVEIVYHVGAAMKGGPNEFEAGTIWGTKNIIEACLKHSVRRLIYVSSVGVLDHAGHPDGVPVTEDSPLEPHPELRGLYTQTKLLAERLVLQAARERDLPAVIVRPGQIFGPGAEHIAPNGIFALAGQWIVAGQGERLLPLVYIDDVVDGLIAAATAPNAAGHVVHLVDPSPVTQNQYLRWSLSVPGSKPVRRTPMPLLMAAGWICEVLSRLIKRPLPLSRYRIKSLRPLSPADVSRAGQILGWSPTVGAARGLELTFGGSQKP